jgi:hypothetical protein
MPACTTDYDRSKWQTQPRQRGRLTLIKPQLSDSNKNMVLGPRWGLTPGLTGRLTVGCNVTLTSKPEQCSRQTRVCVCCMQACVGRRGPVSEWVPTRVTPCRRGVASSSQTSPLVEEEALLKSLEKKNTFMGPDMIWNQELLCWHQLTNQARAVFSQQ